MLLCYYFTINVIIDVIINVNINVIINCYAIGGTGPNQNYNVCQKSLEHPCSGRI